MYNLLFLIAIVIALSAVVQCNDDDNNKAEESEGVIGNDFFENFQKLSNLLGDSDEASNDDFDDDRIPFAGKADGNTYCHARDENPYQYFSTKTVYPQNNASVHFEPIPGCQSKYIWMTMRHGVRYATTSKCIQYVQLTEFRDKIIENVGKEKANLCMEDVFGFLFWVPEDLSKAKPNGLTPNGRQQIMEFGKMIKGKFPNLFPENYDSEKCQMDYTNEDKSIDSVEAMMEALFGVKSLPKNPTGVLSEQLYVKCKRPKFNIDRETRQNYTYLMEHSPEADRMCLRVSEKLGFQDQPLSYYNVSVLYNACQYELAWGRSTSPWCAAFEKEDLQLMEYIGDISYYYFCGPGNPYNMLQGCVILKDLIHQLRSAAEAIENDLPHHTVSMYMGHSTSILHIAAQLGIINDNFPLTHRNYIDIPDRLWRTSIVSPYNANIIIILYECNFNEKYQIKILLNEKPVIYPNICDKKTGLCSLHSFQKMFQDFITWDQCSHKYCSHTIDEICFVLGLHEHECNGIKSVVLESTPDTVQTEKSFAEEQKRIKQESQPPPKLNHINALLFFLILTIFSFAVVTFLDNHLVSSSTDKRKEDQESKKKKNDSKNTKTLCEMEKQPLKQTKKGK